MRLPLVQYGCASQLSHGEEPVPSNDFAKSQGRHGGAGSRDDTQASMEADLPKTPAKTIIPAAGPVILRKPKSVRPAHPINEYPHLLRQVIQTRNRSQATYGDLLSRGMTQARVVTAAGLYPDPSIARRARTGAVREAVSVQPRYASQTSDGGYYLRGTVQTRHESQACDGSAPQ